MRSFKIEEKKNTKHFLNFLVQVHTNSFKLNTKSHTPGWMDSRYIAWTSLSVSIYLKCSRRAASVEFIASVLRAESVNKRKQNKIAN